MALTRSLVVGPDRNGRVVRIVDGRVAAVCPENADHLACRDGEIAPGRVCAHTHLYSGLVPYGMPLSVPAPTRFPEILDRVWWRLDRAIDADILTAAAEDYIARALLAGTTTIVDHHESPALIEGSLSILSAACHRLGIRALLCYGATERNGGLREAERGLAECASIPGTDLVRPMIGLHAGFTVSDATVIAAGNMARGTGMPLHIHVAEDECDVADARRRGYAGPVERLADLGALVPGSVLAHGVHLAADQVRRAGDAGCWLVHNPRSNEGNKVGYAGALSEGTRVALGTDGWDPDMTQEEAALRRLGRLHGDTGIEGRLAAGARLVADRFGTAPDPLAPGSLGDLIVCRDGVVRHVVVGGRPLVIDASLTVASRTGIETNARREANRLWQRMTAL